MDYEEAMNAFEQSGLIPTDGQFHIEIIVNESDTSEEDHNDESSKTILPRRVLTFTATRLLELFESNSSGRSSIDGSMDAHLHGPSST